MFAIYKNFEYNFNGIEYKIDLTDSNLFLQYKNRQKWEGQKLVITLPDGAKVEKDFVLYATQGSSFRKVCKAFSKLTEAELVFITDAVFGDISRDPYDLFPIYFDLHIKRASWYDYHKSKKPYREGFENHELVSSWVLNYLKNKTEKEDGKPSENCTSEETPTIVRIAKMTDDILGVK